MHTIASKLTDLLESKNIDAHCRKSSYQAISDGISEELSLDFTSCVSIYDAYIYYSPATTALPVCETVDRQIKDTAGRQDACQSANHSAQDIALYVDSKDLIQKQAFDVKKYATVIGCGLAVSAEILDALAVNFQEAINLLTSGCFLDSNNRYRLLPGFKISAQ